MYAIDALFVVAVAAPLVLVIIYRWKEVPRRCADIKKMMKAAFENPDEAKRQAAHKALENNPYISDPEETFENFHKPWRYVFPLLVLVTLTISSAYIAYAWIRYRLTQPVQEPVAAHVPLVIIMALAGGYVWSVYQIFARIRASELSPADLYEIDLGLLVAVPIGLAFSLITAEQDGVRSFMAFAASAFPLREISRLVRQYATRQMIGSADAATTRPAERHLGTAIEGLSDQTLARLSELRITTVLDMAYCDPIRVMVQTGFALPVIIDWIDQSIWALYAGDLKTEINKCGIRCSLDVCEFVDLHLLDAEGKRNAVIEAMHKEAVDVLSQKLSCQPPLLQDLLFRIYCDPQVVVLRRLWYPQEVPKELRA